MRHYMNQEQSKLKELSHAHLDMDPILLHDVARTKSLRHLYVRMENILEIMEANTVEFSRLISQLPNLTGLNFYGMKLSTEAARYIGGSRSLRRFDSCYHQDLDNEGHDASAYLAKALNKFNTHKLSSSMDVLVLLRHHPHNL
ncbi:hypothetical protein BJV82DRAFT_698840 [Fennellomyces sp. T-0311]|nr:hypothetical protein BJV82DRAFT_698840 [Fennellomyces sp. T-0311]